MNFHIVLYHEFLSRAKAYDSPVLKETVNKRISCKLVLSSSSCYFFLCKLNESGFSCVSHVCVCFCFVLCCCVLCCVVLLCFVSFHCVVLCCVVWCCVVLCSVALCCAVFIFLLRKIHLSFKFKFNLFIIINMNIF